MFGKKVLFDVGAWVKDVIGFLPYALREAPVSVSTLKPGRWLMQVPVLTFVRFDHSLEEVMGTYLIKDGESLITTGP